MLIDGKKKRIVNLNKNFQKIEFKVIKEKVSVKINHLHKQSGYHFIEFRQNPIFVTFHLRIVSKKLLSHLVQWDVPFGALFVTTNRWYHLQ